MGNVNYQSCLRGEQGFARLKKEKEQNTERVPSRLLYKVHQDLVSAKVQKRK
jgi:hypothetical protein